MQRRNFLKLSLASLSGASAFGITNHLSNTYDFQFEEFNLKLENLPKNFNNYRIGFLTDIHAGPYLSFDYIDQIINEVNKKDLDLVLLGGDYIAIPKTIIGKIFNHKSEVFNKEYINSIYKNLSKILKSIKSKDGIYSILGNHDRWVGQTPSLDFFNNETLNLLINQKKVIKRANQSLRLLGLDDYWTGVPEFNDKLKLSKDEARILLCHNPDYISKLLKSNYEFNLALCGHTHAGQIKLPLVGSLVKNVEDPSFLEGLVRIGNKAIYTSRGIGTVEIPLRLNCAPEISIITLTT